MQNKSTASNKLNIKDNSLPRVLLLTSPGAISVRCGCWYYETNVKTATFFHFVSINFLQELILCFAPYHCWNLPINKRDLLIFSKLAKNSRWYLDSTF